MTWKLTKSLPDCSTKINCNVVDIPFTIFGDSIMVAVSITIIISRDDINDILVDFIHYIKSYTWESGIIT